MTHRRLFLLLISMSALAAIALAGAAILGADRAAKAAPSVPRADKVLITKKERKLKLIRKGKITRIYRIALGFKPTGHKTTEGDGKTPEGHYIIDAKNPKSRFHLSLRISYPNGRDRSQARRRGVSPGGDIFIHGQPNRLRGFFRLPGDWTLGCIAVSNREIREIWHAVKVGTPVEIRP